MKEDKVNLNVETEEERAVLPDDYAGIFISPEGEVKCYMPNADYQEDGMVSTTSPTWIGMVIMTAIQVPEIRDMAEKELAKRLNAVGADDSPLIIPG